MKAFKKLDTQIKAFLIASITLTALIVVMVLTQGLNAL